LHGNVANWNKRAYVGSSHPGVFAFVVAHVYQFGGFGNRLNNTLAAVEEGINTLTTKVRAMRPGEVLGMGVDENPNAVSDGFVKSLENGGGRVNGALQRAMGQAR